MNMTEDEASGKHCPFLMQCCQASQCMAWIPVLVQLGTKNIAVPKPDGGATIVNKPNMVPNGEGRCAMIYPGVQP